MAIFPALMQAMVDDGAAGLNLTILPPAAGNYTNTQVWYRRQSRDDWPWSDGGQYVGAQGVPGVHNLAALGNDHHYQALVVAWDAVDGFATPSTPRVALVAEDTDPVVERVCIDAEQALNFIAKANGFYNDAKEVHRVKRSGLITPNTYPAIVMQGLAANTQDGQPVEHVSSLMDLYVEGWVKTSTDIDIALNRLMADIEYALAIDWRRGGNAVTTKLLRWDKITTEEVKPYGGIRMVFQVHYRNMRTNPAVNLGRG